MKQFNLKVKEDKKYLQLTDLPKNCIFNKVTTGCGGTTITLANNKNYIICVPTIELILNKMGLDINTKNGARATINPIKGNPLERDVFGYFGDRNVANAKLFKYLETNTGVKKILCTYNKLGYVANKLKYMGYDPKDFNLLVDEYHSFINKYTYAPEVVEGILSHFKDFKQYCFLSATPISESVTPDELLESRLVNAVWKETEKLNVELMPTNKPYTKVANLIKQFQKDGYLEDDKGLKTTHLHIFLNSVRDIAGIVEHCSLTPEEVHIVCADNIKNCDNLADFYSCVSSAKNASKKPFTFITRKAFEGVDFECEDGLCIVVSNTAKKQTLLDISTDIIQIAGRIRTDANPFKHTLLHIFNTTGKRSMKEFLTPNEVQDALTAEAEASKLMAEQINACTNELVKLKLVKRLNRDYFREVKGVWYPNTLVYKVEYHNYLIENEIYRNGITLKGAYESKGANVLMNSWETLKESIKSVNRSKSFKDAYLAFMEGYKKDSDFKNTDEGKYYLALHPLIENTLGVLTEEEVRGAKYMKTQVEALLVSKDDRMDIETKVASLVCRNFSLNKYPSKDIKKILQNVYDSCGLDKKAKANDIENYFETKIVTFREDGKVKKQYLLIAPKVKINAPIEKKEEVIVEEDKQTKVDWDAINYNEMINKTA